MAEQLKADNLATKAEPKLSKKQQKSASFKKSKLEREQEKAEKKALKAKKEQEQQLKESEKNLKRAHPEDSESLKIADSTQAGDGEEAPKKKRKTRRGKKGKGVNGGKGPRFILFVGNLPYDTQEEELLTHFKGARPDRLRIRREKGIAFMEFDNDNKEIQSRMDHALRMQHLVFRNRKINVELTVGGGGNSEQRQQKLKDKNEKLQEERKERLKKELKKREKEEGEKPAGGMHPARAAMLKQ